MRRFIPLSIFKELYTSQSDLLTEQGMRNFHDRLGSDGMRLAQASGFNTEDFIAFRETLIDPSNVVYYGWIEQNTSVKNILLGQKLSPFVDSGKHLSHSMTDGYKRFISPLLSDILIKTNIRSDTERMNAFSFVQLLDEKHRAVVEGQLFKPYQEQLEAMKRTSEQIDDEQELVNLVKPLCSDEIIAIVNYLSRASYATKRGYVDKILNTIHSKACTVRFANWVLERMSLINLNNEHLYKLTDLRKDLRKGNLTVKNHKRGRTPIRWKGLVTLITIAALLGSVILIVVYKPFSKVEETTFSNDTSFKEFTKEERIRMDSLLRVMDNPFDRTNEIDPSMIPIQTGVDVDLVLRKSFKNERMEAIYDDLMLDVELKENYADSSCADQGNAPFNSTSGLKSLDYMTGMHTAVVRNESDYDIILYVAENSKNGKVFASLIEPNNTVEFKINKFNTLLAVAGNAYQTYAPPANSTPEEHPTESFTHHFCDTDLNYEETINTSYQFLNPKQGKNKFMVMGAKSGYVHLVDVHDVLEVY